MTKIVYIYILVMTVESYVLHFPVVEAIQILFSWNNLIYLTEYDPNLQ